MMAELGWIHIASFLIAATQITAAAAGLNPLPVFVRPGEDVTLPCGNVIKDQKNCEKTTWTFTGFQAVSAIELVLLGDVINTIMSDRLSVTENCSLVVKKVTVEDVGRYVCEQYMHRTGQKQAEDFVVDLSVVELTKRETKDEVTLTCYVTTYDRCRQEVKWTNKGGGDLDKDNGQVKTSQSSCSASVTALTSHFILNVAECKVTEGDKSQTFPFKPQPSAGTTITTTTATSTTSTTTAASTTSTTTATSTTSTTTATSTTSTTTATSTTSTTAPKKRKGDPWPYVIAAVIFVSLLMICVFVILRRKRAGGTRKNGHAALTLNPAVHDSSLENKADPEDGVSYASISYTRNGTPQVRIKSEDDSVTYSTVRAPFSSPAPSSADPANLYATVNKPNK